MRVEPNLSTEVNGGEDGGGVYPDIMEDVGTEWSNKRKWVSVKVGDTRDVTEEVSVDELLL